MPLLVCLRLGLIMLHIGVFAHPLLMFRNFVKGAEKELMIQSACISDQEPNDRSLFNLDRVRLEKHVSAFCLPDGYFDRPVE